MKVQLVVVQGKPEGMTIPLAGPSFKIGRGESCQLKPNSDLVSREHAEFVFGADSVSVQDLGSRNGTDVNGKKLAARQPVMLRTGDLIKIGSLTFAIAIEGVPVAKEAMPVGSGRKPSLDDISGDEIDSWLVSDETRPTPDRPSGVYGGDTMTLDTYQGKEKAKPAAPAPVAKAPAPVAPAPPPVVKAPAPVAPAPVAKAPEPEPAAEPEMDYGREEESEAEPEDDGIEDLAALQAAQEDEMPEDLVDESNPFYVKKPEVVANPTAGSKGASSRDSSDVAGDILRKMMDRRRASKP